MPASSAVLGHVEGEEIVGQVRTDDTEVTVEDKAQAEAKKAADLKERDKLKSAAYSAAMAALREDHRDEFEVYLSNAYAVRGLVYNPRPKPIDVARQQIETLLDEFPQLAAQIAKAQGVLTATGVSTIPPLQTVASGVTQRDTHNW